MKVWLKALCGIALSLMCLFTGIGYAQISDSLSVVGNSDVVPPNILFVTNVGAGTVGTLDRENLFYHQTVVTTSITLEEDTDGSEKAVYQVTIWNNTPNYQNAFHL